MEPRAAVFIGLRDLCHEAVKLTQRLRHKLGLLNQYRSDTILYCTSSSFSLFMYTDSCMNDHE
jgi:hypothetical protein